MPVNSGVAAVLGPPPIEANAGQDILSFVERLHQVMQAKKELASKQVMSSIELAKQGFPVDPKMFSKFVKQSGLPISVKEEDLAAQITAAKSSQQGPMTRENAGKQMSELQNTSVQATQAAKQMSPQERLGAWVNQMATRAQKMMNLTAQTDEAKAQNGLLLEQMKTRALAGDKVAAGELIRANQWDKGFNIDFAKWDNANPEQKAGMIDIAAGVESPADKAKRGTEIGKSILESGRVSDPATAYKIGTALVNNESISPDLQKQIKPFTFSELADQARLTGALLDMNVPSDKIGGIVNTASHGGLFNALPTGMKSIAQKTLEQQTKHDTAMEGLESQRLQKEIEIAKKAELAEVRRGITEAQRADIDEFKNLVSLNKIAKVPADLIKGAQIKAAAALNMDVEEVRSLWDHLTGGSHLEFTPKLTNEGTDLVNKLSGRQPAKNKPTGFFDNLFSGVKRATQGGA